MFIFWIVVGMFMGWAIPKPAIVTELQDKAVAWVKGLLGN